MNIYTSFYMRNIYYIYVAVLLVLDQTSETNSSIKINVANQHIVMISNPGLLKSYFSGRVVLAQVKTIILILFLSNNLLTRYEKKASFKSIFNDPDFPKQWYLANNKVKLSHKLEDIWRTGITGLGIIVAILEAGIDVHHNDLRDNFNPNVSYDFVNDVASISYEGEIHGNWMAGMISAVPNNNICGVGAAPLSQFANLIIFNQDHFYVDDRIIFNAFSHKNNIIDIYSSSWIPSNDVETMIQPSPSTRSAIIKATVSGRNHRGNIILFAAGNIEEEENNCGFNGYSQLEGTFTISSLTGQGSIPEYVQRCTAIVASTLSNGFDREDDLLFTTDSNHSCSQNTGYTSASTALAAGIFALLLEASSDLTPRQILFLIATTSLQYDKNHIENKAGFLHSNSIGFGLLVPSSLIKESKKIDPDSFPVQHRCNTKMSKDNKFTATLYSSWIYSSGCYNHHSCVTRMEEVLLHFTLYTKIRNHISIFLTSPSGTRVQVIQPRPEDYSRNGFIDWTIKILTFYGERALGFWVIEIFNKNQQYILKQWALSIYGSCLQPERNVEIHKKVQSYMCQNKIRHGLNFLMNVCRRRSLDVNTTHEDVYSFLYKPFFKLENLYNITNAS